MEVHGRQPDEPSTVYQRFLRNLEVLGEATRERVRHARESLIRGPARRDPGEAAQADRSEEATRRDVVDVHARDPRVDEERARRVDELRRSRDAGTLNTPERVERAAEQMLLSE